MIEAGHVYIAPGSHHLEIVRQRLQVSMRALNDGPPVTGHRPSVDVLFRSGRAGRPALAAVGVILTGMGKDGAEGMLEMRLAGVPTIGQDEALVADLRHAACCLRDAAASCANVRSTNIAGRHPRCLRDGSRRRPPSAGSMRTVWPRLHDRHWTKTMNIAAAPARIPISLW